MSDQIEIIGYSVYRIANGHYIKVDGMQVVMGSVYLAVVDDTTASIKEVGHGLTDAATKAIARLMSVQVELSSKDIPRVDSYDDSGVPGYHPTLSRKLMI